MFASRPTMFSLVGFLMLLACNGEADCPDPPDPFVCNVRAGDFCPYSGSDKCDCGIPGQAFIFLDPSDTIVTVTARHAGNMLSDHLGDLRPLTELNIFTVGRLGADDWEPVFKACLPVDPDKAERNDELYRENYVRFEQKLQLTFEAVFNQPADTISPIVEAFQAAAVYALGKDNVGATKKLFIVSDMVQHSDRLSFIREEPDYGKLSAGLGADLTGFEVDVLLVGRSGLPTVIRQDVRTFWDAYSKDMGEGHWEWTDLMGVSGPSDR